MANGNFEGKSINDPAIRSMFNRDYLLQSDWYHERLKIKQERDCMLWQHHRDYILQRISETEQTDIINQELTQKLAAAESMLAEVSRPSYLENLRGTLGADWVHLQQVRKMII
jgi:hypothetical protein